MTLMSIRLINGDRQIVPTVPEDLLTSLSITYLHALDTLPLSTLPSNGTQLLAGGGAGDVTFGGGGTPDALISAP